MIFSKIVGASYFVQNEGRNFVFFFISIDKSALRGSYFIPFSPPRGLIDHLIDRNKFGQTSQMLISDFYFSDLFRFRRETRASTTPPRSTTR